MCSPLTAAMMHLPLLCYRIDMRQKQFKSRCVFVQSNGGSAWNAFAEGDYARSQCSSHGSPFADREKLHWCMLHRGTC